MIYLDNAATTRVHPQILTLYSKILSDYYANQGSSHAQGLQVNELVNKSKKSILDSLGLGSESYQVVFTSGATEANNLFLKGSALNYATRGRKIITSIGEHSSVLKPLQRLQDDYGFELVILPLLPDGSIDLDVLERVIDDKTILVSLMAVNNETGAINDLVRIHEIIKPYPKCLFHSDVTQALTKINIDYTLLDAFSFSAHKINGLKGSGALVMRKFIQIKPLFEGGNYEYGFRAGTPDSPKNIVLAKTLKTAIKNAKMHAEQIKFMHDKLRDYLSSKPEVILNSSVDTVPYIINFSLTQHRAAVIAAALSSQDIMVGTTSACSAKLNEPSRVIMAMFNDAKRATEVIRVSLGTFNTLGDIETLIKALEQLFEETRRG